MPKKKKGFKPNKTIVELLESIKVPIYIRHIIYIYILKRKQEVMRLV